MLDPLVLELFQYQVEHNSIYSAWLDHLKVDLNAVTATQDIPFLPISFFNTHKVLSSRQKVECTFVSSGTAQTARSRHHIVDLGLYRESTLRTFELFYGDPAGYCFLALLPAYSDESSLMYMMKGLIQASGDPQSGFYAGREREMLDVISKQDKPCLVFGVSFALLELAEKRPTRLKDTIFMETGGMKGRRPEITTADLHQQLAKTFSVNEIHSEYGMCELLSQAYSQGGGLFRCPPWMQVLIRDIRDPLSLLATGEIGAINVIDMANIDSCAFIATEDLGKLNPDGSFEVLGRLDESELRGCNIGWEGM